LSGLTSLLSDYSSIKSGSYGKLLRQYYANQSSSSTSSTSSTSTTSTSSTSSSTASSYTSTLTSSTSTSKDSTKTLSSIEKSTDNLKDSADALLKVGTKSVFQKATVTDAEGNTTKGYDTDKIYDAVKSFVDDYNSVLTDTTDSKTSSITSNVTSLKNTTKANESLLKNVGITIDDKGKLSIDEDTFKKADMSTAKSLFNGTGSYAYQVSAKASMINYNAETEASKSNTYTNSGSYSYNYSSGDLFSSLF
jgi:hypothetical protein